MALASPVLFIPRSPNLPTFEDIHLSTSALEQHMQLAFDELGWGQ
jgi:hypothetical protein